MDAILGLGARGENDHRNFRTSRVAADFPKHRIAIAAGQHHIQNDQVRPFAQSQLATLDAIIGLEHLEACALEVEANQVGDVLFVFDD